MMNIFTKKSLQVSAAVFVGLVGGVENAHAQASGKDFSVITGNITDSISSLPGCFVMSLRFGGKRAVL